MQSDTELNACKRAFRRAPSWTSLRELAEQLLRAERWELAAAAFSHLTCAHPHDAQAFAKRALALSRLQRHALAAEAWACACRIQPDNAAYEKALAAALHDSERPRLKPDG